MVGELKVAFNRQIADAKYDQAVVFFKEKSFNSETRQHSIVVNKFAIDKTKNLDDQFDQLSETWDLVSLASEEQPLPTLERKTKVYYLSRT